MPDIEILAGTFSSSSIEHRSHDRILVRRQKSTEYDPESKPVPRHSRREVRSRENELSRIPAERSAHHHGAPCPESIQVPRRAGRGNPCASVCHRVTRSRLAARVRSGKSGTNRVCGSPFLRARCWCRSACTGFPRVCRPSAGHRYCAAPADTPRPRDRRSSSSGRR